MFNIKILLEYVILHLTFFDSLFLEYPILLPIFKFSLNNCMLLSLSFKSVEITGSYKLSMQFFTFSTRLAVVFTKYVLVAANATMSMDKDIECCTSSLSTTETQNVREDRKYSNASIIRFELSFNCDAPRIYHMAFL